MEEQLILLLAAALGERILSADGVKVLDCLPLAQKHGVANMLYYALPYLPAELQPTESERRLLKELAYAAAAREAVQERELDALLARFEAERIPVLPLKGCILKTLYPKPEMRYMSDVDLLFDAKQAARVREVMQDLGYETVNFEQGDTDFYVSPTRLNYELHRSLRDESFNEGSRRFLEALLSSAKPQEGKTYILELPQEAHYAYLLCHFVKHLINGGIGVRQVMDIYICKHGWSLDEKKCGTLLEQLELTEFAATLERLAECWFGGREGDAVTDELGAYIFGSGTFGTDKQRVADRILREQEKNNRVLYVLRRVFLPYKTMCAYFPSLKKVPFLLPFYWIFRILRGIFCRNQKLSEEINTVFRTTDEAVSERAAFYRRCGLKIYDKR
ncbi:MAG: nucleotidyltransferase family protein [Faecousia sp.]